MCIKPDYSNANFISTLLGMLSLLFSIFYCFSYPSQFSVVSSTLKKLRLRDTEGLFTVTQLGISKVGSMTPWPVLFIINRLSSWRENLTYHAACLLFFFDTCIKSGSEPCILKKHLFGFNSFSSEESCDVSGMLLGPQIYKYSALTTLPSKRFGVPQAEKQAARPGEPKHGAEMPPRRLLHQLIRDITG